MQKQAETTPDDAAVAKRDCATSKQPIRRGGRGGRGRKQATLEPPEPQQPTGPTFPYYREPKHAADGTEETVHSGRGRGKRGGRAKADNSAEPKPPGRGRGRGRGKGSGSVEAEPPALPDSNGTGSGTHIDGGVTREAKSRRNRRSSPYGTTNRPQRARAAPSSCAHLEQFAIVPSAAEIPAVQVASRLQPSQEEVLSPTKAAEDNGSAEDVE